MWGQRERGIDWQRCSNEYLFTFVFGRKENVEYLRLKLDSYFKYKETFFFFLNYPGHSYFFLLTEKKMLESLVLAELGAPFFHKVASFLGTDSSSSLPQLHKLTSSELYTFKIIASISHSWWTMGNTN